MDDATFVPAAGTFDAFANVCKFRKSVRFFGTKEIPQEKLLALLALAGHAPSVKNLQPWHFHVVLNRKLRSELMEASCYGNFVEGAAAFLVVTCDAGVSGRTQDVIWNPRELEYSCVVAMTHVLLGASALGLGSCWVSLHEQDVRKTLSLEKNHTVVGGIMLGHISQLESREKVLPRSTKPKRDAFTMYP
ncbi:MAG TPA: nitroreductase family protein [Candidatus Peribacteria bacterium]|nr:nitroreductase family protein [Candidatus Peribacteria bacterium]